MKALARDLVGAEEIIGTLPFWWLPSIVTTGLEPLRVFAPPASVLIQFRSRARRPLPETKAQQCD
jgi:hypothetical protein